MAGSPSTTWDQVRERLSGRLAAAIVATIGVAIPLWRMAERIATSSRMQYSDYWPMLDSFVNDDASIRWQSLLEARNGHPIVVAKLLYIVNVWLADGSNWTQAMMVMALAMAIIALVAVLARGTDGLGRWGRVAVVVFTAFIVLAPAGSWTYIKAMSGTAWLSANLFFVAALVLQQRDRKVLSVGAAVLATISYGTALAVWPAMAVAGLLRHGRRWQEQWLVWLGGSIAVGLYLRWRILNPVRSASGEPLDIVRRSVLLTTERFLPGRLEPVSIALSVLTILGAIALWTHRSHLRATAPWVAMVVYGVVATVMISRTRPIEDGPDSSRYWSISMWIWLGFFVVVLLATRGHWWRPVIGAVLAVVILASGTRSEYNLRGATENNDLLAIGVVAGIAEGNKIAGGRQAFPPITDKLRALGHYPFDGTFDHGCGLIDKHVEIEPLLPAGLEGGVEIEPMEGSLGVMHHAGWVDTPDGSLECVVMVDAYGKVLGAGIHRTAVNRGGRHWIRSVGRPDYFPTVAVRFEPDGPLYRVPTVP